MRPAAVQLRLVEDPQFRVGEPAAEGELVGGHVNRLGVEAQHRVVRPVAAGGGPVRSRVGAPDPVPARGVAGLRDAEHDPRALRVRAPGGDADDPPAAVVIVGQFRVEKLRPGGQHRVEHRGEIGPPELLQAGLVVADQVHVDRGQHLFRPDRDRAVRRPERGLGNPLETRRRRRGQTLDDLVLRRILLRQFRRRFLVQLHVERVRRSQRLRAVLPRAGLQLVVLLDRDREPLREQRRPVRRRRFGEQFADRQIRHLPRRAPGRFSCLALEHLCIRHHGDHPLPPRPRRPVPGRRPPPPDRGAVPRPPSAVPSRRPEPVSRSESRTPFPVRRARFRPPGRFPRLLRVPRPTAALPVRSSFTPGNSARKDRFRRCSRKRSHNSRERIRTHRNLQPNGAAEIDCTIFSPIRREGA